MNVQHPETSSPVSKKRKRVDDDFEPESDGSDLDIDPSDNDIQLEELEDISKPQKSKRKAKSGKSSKQESDEPVAQIPAKHSASYHLFTTEETQAIRKNLLAWYDENQRHMPWRKPSPIYLQNHKSELKEGEYFDESGSKFDQAYGSIVSELMLQQTQVVTVRPYFKKWMETFPTVEALANASLEQVNAVWAGLGYYRRAKMLHQCAKTIVEKFGGKIPTNASGLSELPGIGQYTAGAVASVVFGEVTPIVDGNVIRVLSRIRAIAADHKSQVVNKLFWKQAALLVDTDRPGDFNQSMMELGALVCTPKNPSCNTCPIQSECLAYKEVNGSPSSGQVADIEDLCTMCTHNDPCKDVTKYPIKPKKKERKEQATLICILKFNDPQTNQFRYFLSKRSEGGLLAGFYELPSFDMDCEPEEAKEMSESERRSIMDKYLNSTFGIDAQKSASRVSLGTTVHNFTHIKQTIYLEMITFGSDSVQLLPHRDSDGADYGWYSESSMSNLAVPKSSKTCLELSKSEKKLDVKKEKVTSPQKKKIKGPIAGQGSVLAMFQKMAPSN